MTARTGDALSHVYFRRPPTRFSKSISKQTSKPIIKHSESAAVISQAARTLQRRVSSKPNRSYRICITAMKLAGGTRFGVLLPFTCRDFVNTNEHFVNQ
jgi:hypothetical protein